MTRTPRALQARRLVKALEADGFLWSVFEAAIASIATLIDAESS